MKKRIERVLEPAILFVFSSERSDKIRCRILSRVSATRRSLYPIWNQKYIILISRQNYVSSLWFTEWKSVDTTG